MLEVLRRAWRRLNDRLDPPCPNHPGHRELEVDLGAVPWRREFNDKTYMCEACWQEIEARYAKRKGLSGER